MFFFAPKAAPAAAAAFVGIDKNTGVVVPCMSLESYAHSAIGRYFEVLEHKDECDETFNRLKIIYIHDTIVVHDTVCLGDSAKSEKKTVTGETMRKEPVVRDKEQEEEGDDELEEGRDEEQDEPDDGVDEPVIYIDGKTVRIANAMSLRGVGVRVFDDKGRLVVDERIPQSQPIDNYYIRLPKRQRYYMRLDMGTPIVIDVDNQQVKQ